MLVVSGFIRWCCACMVGLCLFGGFVVVWVCCLLGLFEFVFYVVLGLFVNVAVWSGLLCCFWCLL